jgi:hypothetical protein
MRLIQSYVRAVSNCSPLSARSGTDEAPEREALYAEFIVEASKRFADRSEVLNDPDHTGRQHVDALSQNLRELLAQKAKPLAHWNAALQKKLRIQNASWLSFASCCPCASL